MGIQARRIDRQLVKYNIEEEDLLLFQLFRNCLYKSFEKPKD